MRKIVSKEVEQREQDIKNEVKPEPEVTSRKPGLNNMSGIAEVVSIPVSDLEFPERQGQKAILLQEQWAKMKEVKTERAKLSNFARNQWHDGVSQQQLKILYSQIQAKTEEAAAIYTLIEHIEKFGELPRDEKDITHVPNSDVLAMKERKRQLINLRDKLRRNLRPNAKQPLNSDRRSMWEQNLAVYDAEYNDLVERIKKLNYDSRD